MRSPTTGEFRGVAAAPEPAITDLLYAVERGIDGAADRLLNAVYTELRGIARRKVSDQPASATLQPTALVHEAYLRMFGNDGGSWENRRHFYFAAARAMHDILVERARRHRAKRRGGDLVRVDLSEAALLDGQAADVLATSDAVRALEAVDQTAAAVVNLRFYGGLTHEETSQVLGLSSATVRRRWTFARAWLHEALSRYGGVD
jgi:RNA polymerase sigma factor (TIGR02999 family)